MNHSLKKGKEELDLFFTPSQVYNFRVFTNPLLPEEVKVEALQTSGSSLFSSHIPFASKIPLHQPNSSNIPPSSQHSSSNQYNSSSNISSPKMDRPQNRMVVMIAARYSPLVLP